VSAEMTHQILTAGKFVTAKVSSIDPIADIRSGVGWRGSRTGGGWQRSWHPWEPALVQVRVPRHSHHGCILLSLSEHVGGAGGVPTQWVGAMDVVAGR